MCLLCRYVAQCLRRKPKSVFEGAPPPAAPASSAAAASGPASANESSLANTQQSNKKARQEQLNVKQQELEKRLEDMNKTLGGETRYAFSITSKAFLQARLILNSLSGDDAGKVQKLVREEKRRRRPPTRPTTPPRTTTTAPALGQSPIRRPARARIPTRTPKARRPARTPVQTPYQVMKRPTSAFNHAASVLGKSQRPLQPGQTRPASAYNMPPNPPGSDTPPTNISVRRDLMPNSAVQPPTASPAGLPAAAAGGHQNNHSQQQIDPSSPAGQTKTKAALKGEL